MNFLLSILEGGGSVEEHPLIQQLLNLFWLLMEVKFNLKAFSGMRLEKMFHSSETVIFFSS